MHDTIRLDHRLITGLLLACAAPTLAAPITVNSFQATAFCADGPQRQGNNLTALATGTSQVQCAAGLAELAGIVNYTETDPMAQLDASFEGTVGPTLYGWNTSGIKLNFTATEDAAYAISGGAASLNGPANPLNLWAELRDLTAGTLVLHNFQYSYQTPSETLVLGNGGGDAINELTGLLTGQLVAGHQYTLDMNSGAYNYSNPVSYGHTASFQFQVESPAPVPEPSSFALLGLGLAGLAWHRRRARR